MDICVVVCEGLPIILASIQFDRPRGNYLNTPPTVDTISLLARETRLTRAFSIGDNCRARAYKGAG